MTKKEKQVRKKLNEYDIRIRKESKGILFQGKLLSEDEIHLISNEAFGLLEELGGIKERKSPEGKVYIFLR